MAAYSLDLRERIVEAVERQIGSKRKIAELFGVHESFIYKLLRQRRERGDIAPLPHGGGGRAETPLKPPRPGAPPGAGTARATPSALPVQPQKKGAGAGGPRHPLLGRPAPGASP